MLNLKWSFLSSNKNKYYIFIFIALFLYMCIIKYIVSILIYDAEMFFITFALNAY